MAKFSTNSINHLSTCDERLQALMHEVIKDIDCSIICGHRSEAEQTKAYLTGNSKAKFGESKHNKLPSLAVDVVPYPLDWTDIDSFNKLGEVIQAKADELGIKVRWGKYFTTITDFPHWELA